MRSLTRMLGTLAVSTVLGAGCAGTYAATPVEPGYSADLVDVAPGVQVIADYDEPIFYSDGFYWRYADNTWYRSPYYTGGWALARPPVAILRIDRPRMYAHYHPAGWAGHRQVAPPPPARRYYGRTPVEPRRVGPPPGQPRFYQSPSPRRIGPQPVQPAPAPPMHGAPVRPPMHRGSNDRR